MKKFNLADNLGNYAKKGAIPWNKGKRGIYSEETLEKMSQGKLKNPTKYWLGKKRPNMSGKNHWFYGKKRPDRSGEKNNKWKGGSSRAYKTGYYSAEYVRWRNKVFERDHFTCQKCGVHGCEGAYLTAHHIKSFARHPELRFIVKNGLTLCEDCHKLTDNYKGRNKKEVN